MVQVHVFHHVQQDKQCVEVHVSTQVLIHKTVAHVDLLVMQLMVFLHVQPEHVLYLHVMQDLQTVIKMLQMDVKSTHKLIPTTVVYVEMSVVVYVLQVIVQ